MKKLTYRAKTCYTCTMLPNGSNCSLGGIFYEKRQDGLDWNPIFGWFGGAC